MSAQTDPRVRGGQVSGAYVCSGFAGRRERMVRHAGHAHIDGGGYIVISGRSDDTIIKGSENIAPAEIEDVLLQYPHVKEATVVGVVKLTILVPSALNRP